MMSILVGSWDDGVDRSVTISADFATDSDYELMIFISRSTASKNGGSISMDV